MALDRPVFLIGAARSGTTIIGETLATHPDIAFWDEPKYVWRHGAHGASNDARGPQDATPAVTRFIRGRFEQFTSRAKRKRFLEKTPSNCFRVAFVHRVFPEGLYLHVRRDGRDAAASALRRWCSAPDDSAILRRMRGWEIPLLATHHYLPDILRELIFRRLWPDRGYPWGPRYPGLASDIARGLDVVELCAKQWVESERTATAELSTIPTSRVLTFSYEAFVADPQLVFSQVLDFVGLAPDARLSDAMRAVRPDSVGAFRKLPLHQQRIVEAICLPAMRDLGISPATA